MLPLCRQDSGRGEWLRAEPLFSVNTQAAVTAAFSVITPLEMPVNTLAALPSLAPTGTQPLIKGLGNEVIVRDALALKLFPAIQPLDYETAVRLALVKMDARDVETAWTDALTSSQGDKTPVTLISSEGMIIERRQRMVSASADTVYRSFSRPGGKRGWLYMDWAW